MSYADEVLADSPEIYLKLDETSGTTAVDSSGNGRDGVIASGVTLAQAGLVNSGTSVRPGTASANQVYVPHASCDMNVWTAGAFTLEVWFQLDDSTIDSLHSIADKTQLSPGSLHEWYLVYENRSSQGSPGELRFAWQTNTTANMYLTDSAANFENPTHVVVSYDGAGNIAMYVNGILVDSETGTNFKTGSNTSQCTIGGTAASIAYRTQGLVDEFAFYRTALSPARIASHYQAGTAGPPLSNQAWG